jgi:hypothetical protein
MVSKESNNMLMQKVQKMHLNKNSAKEFQFNKIKSGGGIMDRSEIIRKKETNKK